MAVVLLVSLVSTFTLSGSAIATSDEWPGWRGPGGNGVAAGSPPTEWSEEKNVRWKTPLPGKGSSSPVVWGSRIYVTTAVGTGKKKEKTPPPEGEAGAGAPEGEAPEAGSGADEGRGRGGRNRGRGGRGGDVPIEEQEFHVLAIDRASGAIAWQRKAGVAMPHQGTHPDGNYASPTPATDGEIVIASFGSFGVYAYTPEGELAWQVDLGDLEIMGGFGEGSSPVLHGDTVLLAWDHDGESFVIALDKRTGEERWRRSRPAGTNWSTPIVIERDGRAQVVIGAARTVAYDVATGEELWAHGQAAPGSSIIASPVHHDGLVVVATGNRRSGQLAAIDLSKAKGEVQASEALAWSFAGDTPHVSSPVAHDGIVYMLKANSGLLTAVDALSGERLYGPERMSGIADEYASPIVADGRLYFAGRDGTVEVVAAGPEFRSIAVNALDDAFDASPAVAGNELFLRGRAHLHCIASE